MRFDEEQSNRNQIQSEPWTVLRDVLVEQDSQKMNDLLQQMDKVEAVRGILHLDVDEREQLFSLIDPYTAAEIIQLIPHPTVGIFMNDLESKDVAKVISALGSENQADILFEMRREHAENTIQQMSPDSADHLRDLIKYPRESAGGIMSWEAFIVSPDDTVGQVFLRLSEENGKQFYPYVVDDKGKLLGVLSIIQLLSADREQPVKELMKEPIVVKVTDSLLDLDEEFSSHGFFNFPVVDEQQNLLGIVTRIALDEALLEQADSDALKTHGIVGDEVRAMPTLFRAKRRLSWLSGNIVLNIIAASVIASYEATLSAVIAIAIFLPMVSDMSGCSGNQAVAVSMRELALGIIKPIDAFYVWLKEVSVGLINGTVLGILIGVVAWVWKGNPALGLVIGLALMINTVIAVSIGGVVPLLLKKFDIDPAVASGPLLTTITDMAGFFLVLSLATVMMPWLV